MTKATTPLDALLLRENLSSVNDTELDMRAVLSKLRESLQGIHKRVHGKKKQRRLYQLAQKKGTVCNFSEGDYVLWSRVKSCIHGRNLMVRWIGPYQIVTARPYSFMIKHLITGMDHEVHALRLKFYMDSSLEVTSEITEHVTAQGIVLAVCDIVGRRLNTTTNEWELLVAWVGLQDIENSWEPFAVILQDIPARVKLYVDEHTADDLSALCA